MHLQINLVTLNLLLINQTEDTEIEFCVSKHIQNVPGSNPGRPSSVMTDLWQMFTVSADETTIVS